MLLSNPSRSAAHPAPMTAITEDFEPPPPPHAAQPRHAAAANYHGVPLALYSSASRNSELLLPPNRLRPSFFAIFFKRLDENPRNFRSEHLRTCPNFHYLTRYFVVTQIFQVLPVDS